ncbi:hypothetical protein GOP47_0028485 [Adiantum capillus-veneris]|nr:hypothetical protein GOP47_0028485 [Adiantum capillus-veneris]
MHDLHVAYLPLLTPLPLNLLRHLLVISINGPSQALKERFAFLTLDSLHFLLSLLARYIIMQILVLGMAMLYSIVNVHGVVRETNYAHGITKKVGEKNLSVALWNNSTDLLEMVWNSTFIRGVKDGTLNPNFYSAYSMQDAAWCKEISKVWEKVYVNDSAPKALREYAKNSTRSYLECAKGLWEAFTVNKGATIIGSAATSYANIVNSSTINYGSPYIVIATYACNKLWDNITADLTPVMNSSNPYALWVYQNTGSSSSQAAFIDEWAPKWYDWNLSIAIFRQAMGGEIGLFNLVHS